MDAESIAALRETLDGESQELWPEHVAVARAFLASSTQWRVAAGMTRLFFLGLDYAGARVAIEANGIAVTPRLWSDLRVMEIAACAALNGDQQ